MKLIARNRLVLLCKASSQQKDAASQNQAFTTNLQGMFQNQFGNSQAIQGSLNQQLQGLVSQGQAGQGYAPGEEANLRADSKDQAAQQSIEQQQATGQRLAAQGVDPTSGSVAQIDAQGSNAAAAGDASAQRAITTNNANLAQDKVSQGLSGLGSLAGTESSAANGVGGLAVQNASNSYNEVTQAYQPSNFLGNLAGGVLSAGLGAIAGPAGAAIGGGLASAINNGSSGGYQAGDDFGGDD